MVGFSMNVRETIAISKFPIEAVKEITSNEKKSILVGSRNRKIALVDLASDLANNESRIMKGYEGHKDIVTSVDYSAAGDKIISVSKDAQLMIWDRETKANKVYETGHSKKVTSVVLNGANNKIVTASHDGSFILWNTEGLKVAVFDKGMKNGHKSWINRCGFIPNREDRLVTAGEDGTVKIWDLNNNVLLHTYMDGALVDYEKAEATKTPVVDYDVNLAVKAISFSKDGSLLTYGGRDGKVHLVLLSTNQTVQTVDVKDRVTALASGENQPLIAIAIPNKIVLWHTTEARLVGEYVFNTSGEHYCYSLVFVGDELIAGLDSGDLIRIELFKN